MLSGSECLTVTIPSASQLQRNTQDSETQTADIAVASVETNTELMVDVACEANIDQLECEAVELGDNNCHQILYFLKKVTPLVESELLKGDMTTDLFQDYNVSWEEERADVKRHLVLKQLPNCSDVAWNSTGSVIAASYGRSDHNGWCDHRSSLCLWNVLSRKLDKTKADIQIELPCCIMCIAFHPTKPSIIAGGLYNGEIRIWDVSNTEEPLLMTSTIHDLFHREPISNVIWVRDYLDSQRSYSLVSASTDGKVLTWAPANKLEYPRGGYILSPSKTYHGQGSTVNRYPVMGATSVAYSIDASNFVIGTEAGGLVKSLYHSKLVKQKGDVKSGEWRYSVEAARLLEAVDDVNRYEVKRHIERFVNERDGKKKMSIKDIYDARPKATMLFPNGCRFAFSPHSGPVYQVAFSPFHRNLFLSCSTDGTVRVYNILRPKPLLALESTNFFLFDVCWSTGRPLVFAAADAKGNIFIYDLLKDMSNPVHTFSYSDQSKDKVSGIAFNPTDPSLLTTCDIHGRIVTWMLGSELSTLQPGENHVLEMMGGNSSQIE